MAMDVPVEPIKEEITSPSSIIDFRKHPKVVGKVTQPDKQPEKQDIGEEEARARTQPEKPKEITNEAQILKKMQTAVIAVGDLQLETFDTLSRLVEENPKNKKALQSLREVRAVHHTLADQNLLDAVRPHILSAIIDGEGAGQLKHARDIIPWEKEEKSDPYHTQLLVLDKDKEVSAIINRYMPLRVTLERIKDPNEYKKAWDALSEKEQFAIMLLQDIRQIRSDDEVLRRLFDPSFRKAFKQRAENDRTGVTEKRKQARMKAEEEKRLHAEKRQRMVDDRYGVEIPGKGAMRLELVDGKLWRVVDAMGEKELRHEVNIAKQSGNTYFRNLSNAPQWLREAAREKGLI